MKELLEKYPKAAKIVKDYYLELFMKGLEGKDFDEDYLEHVRSQEPQLAILVEILENSPRALFDIFDNNRIFIEVMLDVENSYDQWRFFINHNDINGGYLNRKECEKAAISEAFCILESKLNKL